MSRYVYSQSSTATEYNQYGQGGYSGLGTAGSGYGAGSYGQYGQGYSGVDERDSSGNFGVGGYVDDVEDFEDEYDYPVSTHVGPTIQELASAVSGPGQNGSHNKPSNDASQTAMRWADDDDEDDPSLYGVTWYRL